MRLLGGVRRSPQLSPEPGLLSSKVLLDSRLAALVLESTLGVLERKETM
jgi:hypothetical protein